MLKKSDDQMTINKYRVAANILSKLILIRIIIPKFMMASQLFHVKMYVKM